MFQRLELVSPNIRKTYPHRLLERFKIQVPKVQTWKDFLHQHAVLLAGRRTWKGMDWIFLRPSDSIVFLSGGFKAIQKDVNVTRHSPKNRALTEILKHPRNHHLPKKQISENTPLLKGNKGWQFLKIDVVFHDSYKVGPTTYTRHRIVTSRSRGFNPKLPTCNATYRGHSPIYTW